MSFPEFLCAWGILVAHGSMTVRRKMLNLMLKLVRIQTNSKTITAESEGVSNAEKTTHHISGVCNFEVDMIPVLVRGARNCIFLRDVHSASLVVDILAFMLPVPADVHHAKNLVWILKLFADGTAGLRVLRRITRVRTLARMSSAVNAVAPAFESTVVSSVLMEAVCTVFLSCEHEQAFSQERFHTFKTSCTLLTITRTQSAVWDSLDHGVAAKFVIFIKSLQNAEQSFCKAVSSKTARDIDAFLDLVQHECPEFYLLHYFTERSDWILFEERQIVLGVMEIVS
jgi:hypothetical protein